MIQPQVQRFPAKSALFDAGELDAKVSEYAVVVVEHGTCLNSVRQGLRLPTVRCPDRRAESEVGVVGPAYGPVDVAETNDRDEGAELFASHDFIGVIRPGQNRREQEVALVPLFPAQLSTAGSYVQALIPGPFNQSVDEIELDLVAH